ncbi:hypothetical protein IFM89_036945, partial [Coptis chinensis]
PFPTPSCRLCAERDMVHTSPLYKSVEEEPHATGTRGSTGVAEIRATENSKQFALPPSPKDDVRHDRFNGGTYKEMVIQVPRARILLCVVSIVVFWRGG